VSVIDIPASQYHADALGTEQPSLSSSIAKVLLSESPAHAKAKHPRLSDFPIVRDDADHLEIGTVVHSLLLDGGATVDVLEFDSWRTNASKEARELSRAAGRIPLLAHKWGQARTIADAVKEELRHVTVTPRPLSNGKPEQTLKWMEGDVACRARLDWLSNDHTVIDDLKTSSRSANPHGFDRTIFSMGYQVQAAMYLRAVKAVTGTDAIYRWVAVETTAPYAVSVLQLAPDALALADAQLDHAIGIWRECLATNRWPGYASRVHFVEAPPWEEARWLERVAA